MTRKYRGEVLVEERECVRGEASQGGKKSTRERGVR